MAHQHGTQNWACKILQEWKKYKETQLLKQRAMGNLIIEDIYKYITIKCINNIYQDTQAIHDFWQV